ncbi:MAG: TRAP transporter substrate-binding protein [Butyrivibrio sp.]|nr:TRAP transporter substrate-binding protein [Butyrivibrio sp.]
MNEEKKTKKGKAFAIYSIILTVLLLFICALSFGAGQKSDTVILTYAEVNPLDGTISGEMAKAFKEKTEELSNGKIIIDLQPGGVLGSEDQLLDNLLGGGNIADITRISALALPSYGCEKTGLLAVPYTFTGAEHFWKFTESDVAEEMLMEPHDLGLPLRGLCFGEEGFRNFFFRSEVKDISDLKGKKIRVSSDPILTGMVSDIGGSATVVSFTELYSSLSTGVVDGAEQPTPNYNSNAFYEVAPYLLLDGHTLGTMELIVSDYRWNNLSVEQQEILKEAAEYASECCRNKVSEIEEEAFKNLREKNVTIVEVEDKTPWIEACQNTISKYSAKQKELYQKIVDLK